MNDPPRILIVGVNQTTRKILKSYLPEEAYTLVFVSDKPKMMDQLNSNEVDVIMLNAVESNIDAFGICKFLKTKEHWKHISIAVLINPNNKQSLISGFKAGADTYISNTIDMEADELQARLLPLLQTKEDFDELATKFQVREDLTNILVHDMRTPLTAILGFSELLLLRNAVEAEYLGDLQVIYTQSHRLNTYINDLLMMSRMERKQLILTRTTIDATKMVKHVEKNHRLIAELKGINLVLELPKGKSHSVMLDVSLFQRVLDNLLSNALKFSPAGSTVTLRLEYLDPNKNKGDNDDTDATAIAINPDNDDNSGNGGVSIRIIFKDEGPGIAVSDRERIFNKFEIVKLNKEGVTQVGMGLAFCKSVIEAHKGQIFVKTNKPKGAIFIVEI